MGLDQVTNFATGPGIIFLIGLLMGVIGLVGLAIGRGKGAKSLGLIGGIGVVVIVIGIATAVFAPAVSTGSVTPVANTAVNTLLASSPALVAGETWNQGSSTLTVLLAYNTTGSYFCVVSAASATNGCASGGAGSAAHPLDVVFPLNLIRTDAVNTTALFNLGVTSIPTALSLGTSSSLYSIVGYKAATSTVPGEWQVYNSAGTMANQYPTVSAPSVSTNVLTDGVAVKSFSSTADTLHIHLAGTNSTSAPEAFASALTNYTAYDMGLSISQSTPAAITISFEIICWTT